MQQKAKPNYPHNHKRNNKSQIWIISIKDKIRKFASTETQIKCLTNGIQYFGKYFGLNKFKLFIYTL